MLSLHIPLFMPELCAQSSEIVVLRNAHLKIAELYKMKYGEDARYKGGFYSLSTIIGICSLLVDEFDEFALNTSQKL